MALEAAACGTPVVASAVGGLTTLVDHGHTASWSTTPTRAAYAAAVRRVFDEPLAAERLSHRLGAAGPPLHLARRGRARWWSCTTSWPRAASSSAAERAAPRPRADAVPIVDLPDEEEMAAAVACIDAWAERELAAGGFLVAAERQEVTDRTASYRWYLRFKGEEKDFITVWLTLKQRTLHHEAQFMPAPETNQAEVYAYLLRRNAHLFGMCVRPRARGRRLPGGPGAGAPGRRRRARPHRRARRSLYTDEHFPTAMTHGPPLDLPPPPPALLSAPAAVSGPGPRSVSSRGCRACSSSAAGRWAAPSWAGCCARAGPASAT